MKQWWSDDDLGGVPDSGVSRDLILQNYKRTIENQRVDLSDEEQRAEILAEARRRGNAARLFEYEMAGLAPDDAENGLGYPVRRRSQDSGRAIKKHGTEE